MAQDEQDQTSQTVRVTQIDPEWQVDMDAPVERLVTDPAMMPPRFSPPREVPNYDYSDPRFTPQNGFEQFVYENEPRLDNLGPRAWHSVSTGNLAGIGNTIVDATLGGVARLIGNELYDYDREPITSSPESRAMNQVSASSRGNSLVSHADPLDIDAVLYSHSFGDTRFEIGAQQLDSIRYNPTNGRLESEDDYAAVARLSWRIGGRSGGGRED